MSMLSETLVTLRKKKGLSQQELADKLEISRSAIGMYETGRRDPDKDLLLKFAAFYGVTTDVLLGNNLSETYFHGIEIWSNDFRFTAEQKTRIDEFVKESMLRIKELIQTIASAPKSNNGKIEYVESIRNASYSSALWQENAVYFLNEEYPERLNLKDEWIQVFDKMTDRQIIAWLTRIEDGFN